MTSRPSLLLLTIAATGLTALAHGASLAAAATEGEKAAAAAQNEDTTRMGASIRRDIVERDAAEAERSRKLELREQALAAAEKRLTTDLQGQPETVAGDKSGAPEEADQLEVLARIYQTMKPAKAADVFEQLELGVQVEVAKRMRERSTALVIANMSPKGAAQLTMALAKPDAQPQ